MKSNEEMRHTQPRPRIGQFGVIKDENASEEHERAIHMMSGQKETNQTSTTNIIEVGGGRAIKINSHSKQTGTRINAWKGMQIRRV
jgi:hypothetical protein